MVNEISVKVVYGSFFSLRNASRLPNYTSGRLSPE